MLWFSLRQKCGLLHTGTSTPNCWHSCTYASMAWHSEFLFTSSDRQTSITHALKYPCTTMGSIFDRHSYKENILTFSVLSAIYVATSCLSTACYGWNTCMSTTPSAISVCYQWPMSSQFYQFKFCMSIKHRGKDVYAGFDDVMHHVFPLCAMGDIFAISCAIFVCYRWLMLP